VIALVERIREPKVATLDHRHFRTVRPTHVLVDLAEDVGDAVDVVEPGDPFRADCDGAVRVLLDGVHQHDDHVERADARFLPGLRLDDLLVGEVGARGLGRARISANLCR
jgi:hypothetical protein